MARIVLAGDTCPIGRNERSFAEGDARSLLNDLAPDFLDADLRVLNLECPLIDSPSPIRKQGPTLGAPTRCAPGFLEIGVDTLALANNHIMDHGNAGLESTLTALKEAGISCFGAGHNQHIARKILVRELQGIRFGFLAMAEHEFSVASEVSPGANVLDIVDAVRNILESRDTYDFLIVLLHAGNEYYPFPRPGLMDTCRFLVEMGASCVVCQQSHCAGCMETYLGAPILYGQGNFIFDYPSRESSWGKGLLAVLDCKTAGALSVRIIPFSQSPLRSGVSRMSKQDESQFLETFWARSDAIRDGDFVRREWVKFCNQNRNFLLHGINGRAGFVRRAMGKLDLLRYLDSPDVLRRRLHFIRCESLREAIITLLTQEIEH
jgi:hypothetical protein